MSYLHYQIVYKWFWSEDEKPRGLSHTGKQERVGFAALALCSPWSLKWQVFVLAGWEVEIYSISYSVMLCVTLRKVNYSLPVMYIKNALALLHKMICLCWIYFWNPRTRNFQMRVQPVPLGSQTRTRVLFFSAQTYPICLEEYQILFFQRPPSDEFCVPHLLSLHSSSLLLGGAPFYRNTVLSL